MFLYHGLQFLCVEILRFGVMGCDMKSSFSKSNKSSDGRNKKIKHYLTNFIMIAVLLIVGYFSLDRIGRLMTSPTMVLSGQAAVDDPHIMTVEGRSVRILGVLPPSSSQPCYDNEVKALCRDISKAGLENLVSNQAVRCNVLFIDQADYAVSNCYIGELNMGAEMVERGWAIADKDFTNMYLYEELLARFQSSGLWNQYAMNPRDYQEAEVILLKRAAKSLNDSVIIHKLIKEGHFKQKAIAEKPN